MWPLGYGLWPCLVPLPLGPCTFTSARRDTTRRREALGGARGGDGSWSGQWKGSSVLWVTIILPVLLSLPLKMLPCLLTHHTHLLGSPFQEAMLYSQPALQDGCGHSSELLTPRSHPSTAPTTCCCNSSSCLSLPTCAFRRGTRFFSFYFHITNGYHPARFIINTQ